MASKTNNFKKKNNRNIGTLIGSIVILLIVVVSFVLSPALSKIGQTALDDIELGSYGKEKITFSFLKDTPFRTELASISNNSSDSMDPRLAQVAYNRAVSKAAAVEEFNSNGYFITKEQIDDAVLKSGYYSVNGTFSPSVFKNTTESKKLELRQNIEREMKVDSWIYNTLYQQKRSKSYLNFISSFSNLKRNFRYVTFNYSEYPDELILNYANENSIKFTELNLSRITVDDKSIADEILAKIANKEATFSELAPQYSSDNFKTNGGALSSVTYEYELESLFGIANSENVLSLKIDNTPIVIENDNQFILLTVNKEIKTPTFDDLSTVKKYMLTYERGTIEDYFYKIIEDNNSNSLLTFGKEVKTTGLFSINFGSDQMITTSIDRVSQDSIFTRAVSNENFFTTLFNLEDEKLSSPIVLGDSISIFKLLEEKNEESVNNEYILSAFDRNLLNYKSMVVEDLIHKSEKYVDNFYKGYFEILSINQGI